MTWNKPPVSVIIIAGVYIAVGAIGFAYHFPDLYANGFRYNGFLIELTEFLALLCGVFLLRGQNWARWLALAWIAFHVVLSAFHALPQFAVHAVFCAVIAWILFRPNAARYFHGA